MVDLRKIRSLTEFQRNAKKHIDRLKQTGKPEVLTVNGEAEIVIQSADAYQQLLEDSEFARSLRVITQSLAESKAGKTKPARSVLKSLAAKHGVKLDA